MGFADYFRLARAGFILAREGAFGIVEPGLLPPSARGLVKLARLVERPEVKASGKVERLNRALNRLGPTYVKFGQTLATRPDIVGVDMALQLSALQDRMEPFDPALVPDLLAQALGVHAAQLTDISPPIAAASIAQVHKATLIHPDGTREKVAVKVLRPGVRERFRNDLASYMSAARLGERLMPGLRRLKPVEVVETLQRSAALELDLRLEAASISEMAQNIAGDKGFAIPDVKWDQTSDGVLTTAFIDAIPIRDHAAIAAAGIDRRQLAITLMQSFLKHAIGDGFFHADMHPGNLFADPRTGGVVAVDFGIMGRINPRERRFLADVLYGFIQRDYRRIAIRHFEIGYVPKSQSVDDFALALRAIGEPLHGRTVRDISMAKVLGQLFATTEMFDMQTRPELVLLQKNMVLVEGVCRSLDPDLDLFVAAEPVVTDWLKRNAGPMGQLDALRQGLETWSDTLGRVPRLVERGEALLVQIEANQHEARHRSGLTQALSWSGLIAAILLILLLLRLLFAGS